LFWFGFKPTPAAILSAVASAPCKKYFPALYISSGASCSVSHHIILFNVDF
jgi:hypothetical protein